MIVDSKWRGKAIPESLDTIMVYTWYHHLGKQMKSDLGHFESLQAPWFSNFSMH